MPRDNIIQYLVLILAGYERKTTNPIRGGPLSYVQKLLVQVQYYLVPNGILISFSASTKLQSGWLAQFLGLGFRVYPTNNRMRRAVHYLCVNHFYMYRLTSLVITYFLSYLSSYIHDLIIALLCLGAIL